MAPELLTHPLDRADGSAVFFDGLYGVLAAVNGPVEVSRRDELPEEAAIEVNVRPSSGVGGPQERWLETLVQSVMRPVLLVHMHPRTMIQITLQVTKEPDIKLSRSVGAISIISALVNAAFLTLLDGGLPLARTATAVLYAVTEDGKIQSNPTNRALASCTSIHAMAFDQHGEQLLNESSGRFDSHTWDKIAGLAQKSCLDAITATGVDASNTHVISGSQHWLRDAIRQQVAAANAWRSAS